MIGEVPSAAVWNSWGARISTRPPRVTVINDNPDFLALMGDILASDHFVPTLLDEDEPDVLERAGKSKPDLGLMSDSAKDRFAKLTSGERQAIIAYVKARAAQSQPAP